MSSLLFYALSAMGICRTFFAPKQFLGLGLVHLFTLKEITRITDIITHTLCHSITGSLYNTSWEIILIDLGAGCHDKHLSPMMPQLLKDSLIKSTWLFLEANHFRLQHNIQLSPQREGDREQMHAFLSLKPPLEHMLALNRCWLYPNALFISNITSGDGLFIEEYAWQGRKNQGNTKCDTSWPVQGNPSF
jgi:hypothetical protein